MRLIGRSSTLESRVNDDEESLHRPVHEVLHKSLSKIESAQTSDDLIRISEKRAGSGYSWTRKSESDLRSAVADRPKPPAKRPRSPKVWWMAFALVAILLCLFAWRLLG